MNSIDSIANHEPFFQAWTKHFVLVCLDCCNLKKSYWVAYKQARFISQSYGSWKVQDQDVGRFSV